VIDGGHPATFSAKPQFGFAERVGGLSFVWQHNGSPVVGAGGTLVQTQSATLYLPSVSAQDAGEYDIVFSNECGAVESQPATLIVNKAHITDINADGQVDDADFLLFTTQYDLMLCTDALMPDACSADFNHDGFVDDADFTIFIPAYNALLFH